MRTTRRKRKSYLDNCGRLYAINTVTGEKVWDILTGGEITSSPAVVDGVIYVGSHDGNLYAIE